MFQYGIGDEKRTEKKIRNETNFKLNLCTANECNCNEFGANCELKEDKLRSRLHYFSGGADFVDREKPRGRFVFASVNLMKVRSELKSKHLLIRRILRQTQIVAGIRLNSLN